MPWFDLTLVGAADSSAAAWRTDALGRDFTCNALSVPLLPTAGLCAGEHAVVLDPLGCGVDHLRAGRVVWVRPAADSIVASPARLLRFFRFHGSLGGSTTNASARSSEPRPHVAADLEAVAARAGLLQAVPKKRLGMLAGGTQEVLAQPFWGATAGARAEFWDALQRRALKPPFLPPPADLRPDASLQSNPVCDFGVFDDML